MTKQIYGLIGHPVEHSLSPAMQNAGFAHLGIEAEYVLYDIEPGDLENFLKGDRAKGMSGFNVTVPHKIEVKNYIERSGLLDGNAGKLGAVNTVTIESAGLMRGFNTDGPGFYRSLVEDLKFEPEGKAVFVLGAGGASRAIIMYLGAGPRRILVSDIDDKRAEALRIQFEKYYGNKKFEIVRPEKIGEAIENSDLLINATPMGMSESDPSPVDRKFLRPGLYVYDLVYNRPATALVKEAKRSRCHAVTGLGMLLYQGAIAFEIWTGKKAPVEVMKRALKETLKIREKGRT